MYNKFTYLARRVVVGTSVDFEAHQRIGVCRGQLKLRPVVPAVIRDTGTVTAGDDVRGVTTRTGTATGP